MKGLIACFKRRRIPRNFPLFVGAVIVTLGGYSSVHGERQSAEYAKLRNESLESQFGVLSYQKLGQALSTRTDILPKILYCNELAKLQDVLNAADTFLEHKVVSGFSDENLEAPKPESEGQEMLVKLAPDVWTAIAYASHRNPSFKGLRSMLYLHFRHSCHKVPDTAWVRISKIIHNLSKNHPQNL